MFRKKQFRRGTAKYRNVTLEALMISCQDVHRSGHVNVVADFASVIFEDLTWHTPPDPVASLTQTKPSAHLHPPVTPHFFSAVELVQVIRVCKRMSNPRLCSGTGLNGCHLLASC